MELQDIFKLIDVVNNSKITEIEIEKEGFKLKIKKEKELVVQQAVSQPLTSKVSFQPELSEVVEEKPREVSERDEEEEFPPHLEVIRSPIVGTFYRAPSPDAPPYVEEGDVVEKGQVLCIVEAMKIMNEIESDVKGRIVKILVENAQPVEYGQPLFLIEPMS